MPCKTFRVGVFFDGTGNTKIPDSSKGQMSNIAKLSDLYKVGTFKDALGEEVEGKMLYTNGVGTYDSDIVNFFNPIDRKFDKGGGGGGAKRINNMINDVIAELDAHPYGKSVPGMFKKREIDVFGFSRGAAMARDFVNTFYEEEFSELKGVSFNFIGIYDTVGSFGKAGSAIDMKPKYPDLVDESDTPDGFKLNETYGMVDSGSKDRVDKTRDFALDGAHGEEEKEAMIAKYTQAGWDAYAVSFGIHRGKQTYQIRGKMKETDLFEPYNFNLASQSANKIVHMTAHDEVRKNFPLTNIKGLGSEYSFIGVHSDIGGGYGEQKKEKHSMFLKTFESWGGSSSELERKARLYGEQELAKLKESGMLLSSSWYVDLRISGSESEFAGNMFIIAVYLKANRVVSNDLATVTLYLMHEEATREHVPFKPLTESIPESVKNYYVFAKANKKHANVYATMLDGPSIKINNVHHSAVDPAGIYTNYRGDTSLYDKLVNDSADGGGNDARYIDANGIQVDGRKHPKLAVAVERAIFDNATKKAIIPPS